VFGDEYDPEKNNEKEGLKSRDFHFTPKKKKKTKNLLFCRERKTTGSIPTFLSVFFSFFRIINS
jgi:hypothetical protein